MGRRAFFYGLAELLYFNFPCPSTARHSCRYLYKTLTSFILTISRLLSIRSQNTAFGSDAPPPASGGPRAVSNLPCASAVRKTPFCRPQACAPGLESRLGPTVAPCTDLGPISNYYAERFGFSPECRVVSFTGDNPASLAGLCLDKSDIAISLGTSDSLFLSLDQPRCLAEGHVLASPIDRDAYMVLLWYVHCRWRTPPPTILLI